MSTNRITNLVKSKTENEFTEKLKDLETVDKATLEREFFESLEENVGKKIDTIKEIIELKIRIKEVSEIVSLSYIAKTYFGKTRAWLYQRINGNTVNGKQASLTSEQKETLQQAFKEISEKIGTVSLQ